MPRVRQKPTNPYIQSLMDKTPCPAEFLRDGTPRNCKNLQELAAATSIPYSTLKHYADSNGSFQPLEAVLRTAEAFGVTADKFIRELLSCKAS